MLRMPFGKHKGRQLDEIPHSYLRWVLENVADLKSGLRHAIEEQLGADCDETPGPTSNSAGFEKVIRAWHREMTMRHHPDRGGSHDAMVAVNSGAELFRDLAKQIGGAA